MKREWYRSGSELLDEIRSTKVLEHEIALWYLGQCGFVFKQNKIIYIDPMLNDLADKQGISLRKYNSPFSPNDICADYVICTHNHADHLAPETLAAIAHHDMHTRFIVPSGCISALIEIGIPSNRIIPVSAGIPIKLDDLTITGISAAHPVHAVDVHGNDLALCYSLQIGGFHLLHMGDTYLTEKLLEQLCNLPKPHIFFPPINGGDFFRTRQDCIGNLNFNEAAHLVQLLQPDITIPTHFDMISGNIVNPLHFAEIFMEINPAAKWHIPALGEQFIYHK